MQNCVRLYRNSTSARYIRGINNYVAKLCYIMNIELAVSVKQELYLGKSNVSYDKM